MASSLRAACTPDPKPEKRKVDRAATGAFRCVCCGWPFIEGHHLVPRARGGDDVLENLVALCRSCHAALHGTPYMNETRQRVTALTVRRAIGVFLGSDAGRGHVDYVIRKLGLSHGMAFLEAYL